MYRRAQLFEIYICVAQLPLTLQPTMPSKDTHTHTNPHTRNTQTPFRYYVNITKKKKKKWKTNLMIYQ